VTHGVLVVDKPRGRSSHSVVAVARRALATRKVGHAGTLDPMATGVLVLAVGEGLKVLRYLALDDKVYHAVVVLGAETDTLDADGTVTRRVAVPPGLTLERVVEAARAFQGEIEQVVPAISAIKREGQPLYRRARRGEALELPVRKTHVDALEIETVAGDRIALRVKCGKGFYVRALARDLAAALGTVGHLAELRRTRSGRFELAQCVDFELLELAARGETAARERSLRALLPIEEVLDCAPRVLLDAEGAGHARHGRAIPVSHALGPRAWGDAPVEPLLLCDEHGKLIALGRSTQDGLRVVRGVRSEG